MVIECESVPCMGDNYFTDITRDDIITRISNGYRIIDIRRDVGIGVRLETLTRLVRQCLQRGEKRIALRFTEKSYLYTPTLALLVNYYKIVESRGGTLCLIEPNEGIMELMGTMGLADVIEIAASEKSLGSRA